MSCGMHLDLSMDIMEETRFKKKHSALIQKLSKELPFSMNELEALLLIYYKVQKKGPLKHRGMTKVQFRALLHSALDMTDEDLVCDIVMNLVKGANPIIPMEIWARTMSLFLRGTLEQKIQHCFSCYDLMYHGKLGRDVMLRFLSGALIIQGTEDDADEVVKELIEILVKKMDQDRDGHISFEDYKTTCMLQPLIMEALGTCLPDRMSVHTFLTSFTDKVGKI